MSMPIQNNQAEVNSLFARKGELITQLEIAQTELAQVNQKLAVHLGINQQPTPIPVK